MLTFSTEQNAQIEVHAGWRVVIQERAVTELSDIYEYHSIS